MRSKGHSEFLVWRQLFTAFLRQRTGAFASLSRSAFWASGFVISSSHHWDESVFVTTPSVPSWVFSLARSLHGGGACCPALVLRTHVFSLRACSRTCLPGVGSFRVCVLTSHGCCVRLLRNSPPKVSTQDLPRSRTDFTVSSSCKPAGSSIPRVGWLLYDSLIPWAVEAIQSSYKRPHPVLWSCQYSSSTFCDPV